MTTLPKRWISSFTILAFLTTSLVPLAPVYAGRHPHKYKTIQNHHQEEPSATRAARAHRLTVEEVLQEPVQTTTPSSQSWLPDWLPGFVQNPLSTVVELVASLLGSNIEKTTLDETVASLAALPREAAHRVVKGVKYAVNHPGETLVLYLSAYAAAVSASKGSQTTEGSMDSLLSAHNKRIFPIGNEFQINQNTTGYQYVPAITTLSNGNAFVVWYANPTGNFDIYGSVVAPNGTALSNEFGINEITTGDQEYPSITTLSNGNAFVIWQGDQTGNYDIYGRIFAPNGTALGNEFGIPQNPTGNQINPLIAPLSNGNAFVVWWTGQSGSPGNYVYGRVFYPNGTALSSEFALNQAATVGQFSPSIAALRNGNAFAAWAINSGYIYGRIFAPNGNALSNEFQISQTTGEELVPRIAALSNGNAFVAWHGNPAGTYGTYGRVFDPNGNALSNEFEISQTTGGQYYPFIAVLNNSNVFVAWEGGQTGTYDVYGRVFAPNGTALGNEFGIPQNTTGNQEYPSIAALSNGNAFVVWDGSEIYGQILDLSDPSMITTALQTTSMVTTGLQTSSMMTTGLQAFPSTDSMKIPTTSSTIPPYVLPILLGTCGAAAATCLGVSLMGGCAVAAAYGLKKYKKHQAKRSQQDSRQMIPLSQAYGNTAIVNQELSENSRYFNAIPVKEK